MIRLTEVGKVYQTDTASTWAVGNVSLSIASGEFVSLVGPSGCGKSTLLNMIAGFMAPSSGSIEVDGQPVVAGQIHPELGYIFQKDTLLPWFTVHKNVALGLRFRSFPEERIQRRVAELLEMGHLSEFADAYPTRSGWIGYVSRMKEQSLANIGDCYSTQCPVKNLMWRYRRSSPYEKSPIRSKRDWRSGPSPAPIPLRAPDRGR